MSDLSLDFPFAHGGPVGEANFRVEPADFVVDEQLGFEPSGDGEHLLLHLRKTNQNTRWLVGQLAERAQVRPADVGYCGLKDRRAVTSQWFSLYLPKRELDVTDLCAIEGVELLQSGRHPRKLRRGTHRANRFRIRLGSLTGDRSTLQQRLQAVAEQGVPNYFGEQRFGHNGGNLQQFQDGFVHRSGDDRARYKRQSGKGKRGGQSSLYVSAGRSYLFNRVLAKRVEEGTWNQLMPGERDSSGPLWGRGRSNVSEAVSMLEKATADSLPGWCDALEHSGLSQERRPLKLLPDEWNWQFCGQDLQLEFSLPPGCYATAVLRELAHLVVSRDIVAPSPAVVSNDSVNGAATGIESNNNRSDG
ncbi:tRNA pseudouridine(13) synthase TruD [bacterium SCSIO 12696]|nr:tRNA pseudouridine(13) synthase TruD [bacterium SCSIO 12696]